MAYDEFLHEPKERVCVNKPAIIQLLYFLCCWLAENMPGNALPKMKAFSRFRGLASIWSYLSNLRAKGPRCGIMAQEWAAYLLMSVSNLMKKLFQNSQDQQIWTNPTIDKGTLFCLKTSWKSLFWSLYHFWTLPIKAQEFRNVITPRIRKFPMKVSF